ncbi:diphthine synthase [Sulfuracidifex tepidarius]|uniref:Diphthine synthase n=1 Tax=Sulfuracidifex tepidarius TaxID=1294262 RepID=A0A510E3G0_9CREN|nr:diphthine synthase [Sulfuracidifex tepidarius]BBG23865.1 Diphthine synthase [Sulfuracidifex tepidarius]BBG26620.1 Diphthine synthase [Sulfuracidifex tepidarius]
MGELYFIGMGLSRSLMTNKALDIIRKADVIIYDTYTSFSCDISPDYVRSLTSGKVIEANRDLLENRSAEVISLAKEKAVVVATVGDPMIATTHVSMAIEARKAGVKVSVVPGVSVHCYLISKSMLSSYKFGKSVTIVYPSYGIMDTAPYSVIKSNRSLDIHTILYLDIREGKFMTPNEAVSLLLQMEDMRKENVIKEDDVIVVGSRLGCEDEAVVSLSLSEAKKYDFGKPPHILIFPSNLHYMEADALKWMTTK